VLWLTLASLAGSWAAVVAAFFLWRRVRRLEAGPARKARTPAELEGRIFDSVELSLEAMLEELELKEREILRRIERREAELLGLLERRSRGLGPAASGALEQGGRGEEGAVTAAASSSGKEEAAGAGEAARRSVSSAYREKAAAVWRLAEEGHDVVAIAKQLGIGKGEVELILELKKTS